MLTEHDVLKIREELKEVIKEEIRKEITSGDATVTSPLFQERVRSHPYTDTSVSANTNIFADYTVPHDCILRLIGAFDTATVLSYTLTRSDVTITANLNNGNALTANAAFAFEIPFEEEDKVNFQVEPACKVLHLDVFKIRVPGP